MKRLTLLLAAALLLIPSLARGQAAASQQASADRERQEGVPQGKLTSGTFTDSKIFPGTERDYQVYVPAQYDPAKPASLMVFMDGLNYAKADGAFRVPIVFDNLIHRHEIPVTIAVFVNPGTIPPTKPGAAARSNRSFEYDSMGDRYAKFLVEEFLPVALDGFNVSDSPQDRAVCGISSGGICAFTVAWEMPEKFGRVLSHIGSFTNIRGGWEYPGLIRKTQRDPKPIRVYLQEGRDDLNNLHGNWPLSNHDVAAALQFAGYAYKFEMTDGGHSGQAGGQRLADALRWLWDDQAPSTVIPPSETKPKWEPHPDAVVNQANPQGTIRQMPEFESEVFPGTIRKWSVYVPAQYDSAKPAALMVFQDGVRMSDVKGRWRIPTVFDNLIAKGEMPATIAVFIDPGHEKSKPRQANKASNRGFEYDSLGNRYSRFLLEEILPIVEAEFNISKDPSMRAIGGSSSGAICAFNVAWEHPEQFGKVFSNVGSFTNLRGGNVFPSLVRKTEPKPIRVYMSDTSGDVDNAFGSWPWANQQMASALQYMGYDLRFDWAEGYAHNADFGSLKFPDAMRWLWRNESYQPSIDTSDDLRGDLTLLNLLIPGKSWEVVASDLGFADAPCTDEAGNFYFCDMKKPAIYKLDTLSGETTVLANEAVSGLEFGPDGVLYACQGSKNRVIAIDIKSGDVRTVAENVTPNDMAISRDGFIYITETRAQQVTKIEIASGQVTVVDTGINRPNGIVLSSDGGTLVVSDHGGPYVWTFRVNQDGSLDAKMPTMSLRLAIDPDGKFDFNAPPPYISAAKGDGSAVDKAGRYYVTSALGIQIFDPTGRMCGVLPTPNPQQPLTSCVLAGPGHDYLYITNGSTVYRRPLTVEKNGK